MGCINAWTSPQPAFESRQAVSSWFETDPNLKRSKGNSSAGEIHVDGGNASELLVAWRVYEEAADLRL